MLVSPIFCCYMELAKVSFLIIIIFFLYISQKPIAFMIPRIWSFSLAS